MARSGQRQAEDAAKQDDARPTPHQKSSDPTMLELKVLALKEGALQNAVLGPHPPAHLPDDTIHARFKNCVCLLVLMPTRTRGPASPPEPRPVPPICLLSVPTCMSHRHCRCRLAHYGALLIFTVPLPSIFSSSANPPSCLSRNLGIALDSLFLNLDSNPSGNHNCSASRISPLSIFPATASTPLAWTTAQTSPSLHSPSCSPLCKQQLQPSFQM